MSAPNEIQLLNYPANAQLLELGDVSHVLATKPLLPHILSYPPDSLKELIFLIFTETWSLQVFTTENFQQLDCDIHRQERRPHGHGKIWEIRLFTMKM